MPPEICELAELVESASRLLGRYGEGGWSFRLAKDAVLIRGLDFYGVERLLSAFAGMDSLTDLVIHPLNGHRIEEGEAMLANERLSRLLTDISARARKLRQGQTN